MALSWVTLALLILFNRSGAVSKMRLTDFRGLYSAELKDDEMTFQKQFSKE